MGENQSNKDQAEYWKSEFGHKWIDNESRLDASLSRILERLLDYANLGEGEKVLDIGCGTGASSLAAARIVGDTGHVDAADISTILIERARQRAKSDQIENVTFGLCDAQTHPFPRAKFDCILSRFGMMFFKEPVAAFKNIARSGRAGARLVFITWAGTSKNPWFDIPRQAAADRLGTPSTLDPRAPGPLAFQDIDYVTGLMASAGLNNIAGHETEIDLTPPGEIAATAELISHVGPAARIMKEFNGTSEDAKAIKANVLFGIKKYSEGGETKIPGVFNMFTALCG